MPTLKEQYAKEQSAYYASLLQNPTWANGPSRGILVQQSDPNHWLQQDYDPAYLWSQVNDLSQVTDTPPVADTTATYRQTQAQIPVIQRPMSLNANPYIAAIANPATPAMLTVAPPPPPGPTTGPSSPTNPPSPQAVAPPPVRPDLLVNWQRAHDPAWIAANPGSAATVQHINSFPTIEAYVAADAAGGQAAPAAPAPTTPPPPAASSPTAAHLASRPDLQNNWNAAQGAQFGQSAINNYIKSFPTIEAYVAADMAGSPEWTARSAATAVMPNGVVPPPPSATPTPQPPPPTGPAVWNPAPTTGATPTATDATALPAALAAWRAKPGNENGDANSFLGWWSENGATQDIGAPGLEADFALMTALADSGDQNALQILDGLGYENASPTENLPIEQGLLNAALPGLLQDVEGDAARRQMVDTLSGTSVADYNAARQALSPEANAARLAAELAQADQTTGAISASSATAATEQLQALQTSVAAMQQNLTGELAAKAQALQAQVAAFTANLNNFDATQKAALAEQIATTQRDLEASVTAQRNALATEITALRGAADANSLARKAALQAEIDGLTAAQAPMAKARLDSAQALTTAVNLGLEVTNDALTAQRAKQGYIGSSTFSDASLARAAIGARQQAAGVMGGAREANAADLRTIGARGATEGRTLADEYANNLLTIAGRSATGGRSLADVLAQGTQQIGDTGAAGLATIKANTGAGVMGIGNTGATQSYQDRVGGSAELKALLNSLAAGSAGLAATRATQQQAARDLGTTAKQGYFDNAYTREMAGRLALPALTTGLTGTLATLGNYGNTGLTRAQNSLNWWATNPGTPPTPGATEALVDSSGNAIAGLGAGLFGSAFNAANASNWWQKPQPGFGDTDDMT